MTVTSETSQVEYISDGVSLDFPIDFYFLEETDIQVVVSDSDGTIYPVVLDVDYTITGAGNPSGGNLHFTVAQPLDFKIAIIRNAPATQLTDYQPNDDFPAKSHERALDKLTMLVQQLLLGISNSLRKNMSGLAWDFLGLRGTNIGAPVDPTDVATKGYADTLNGKTVRTPEAIPALPNSSARIGMLLGFDGAGNPYPAAAVNGSATDLEARLRDPVDPSNGSGIVARSTVSLASVADLLSAKQDTSALYVTAAYYPGVYVLSTPSEALGDDQFKWSPLVPRSAHNGGTIISPTVPWNGTQATLAAFLLGTGETQPAGLGCFVSIDSRTVKSERFGAKWDGATDDTVPINAAADYAATLNPNSGPLLANRIGAALELPTGKAMISAPIRIKQSGVRIIGKGEYATLIECLPGFVGEAAILFEHLVVEAVFTSSSCEEFSLDMAGVSAHGILYNHLYDHTDAVNLKVFGTAINKQAYYVRPRAGKIDPISQSLYMRGCTFYKVAAGTTPTVILQTLQEFNLVQVKIWNSHTSTVQGASYPLELQGCRSGSLDMCSFLCTTAHGVNIIDNGRQVTSITLDTPLFENVTGGPVRAVSSNVATFPIANLQVRNPRYEIPTGGEYFLNGCVRGYIEAGARNVNIPSASVQNHIIVDNFTKLVNTNTANTYEAVASVASGDHDFGTRLRIDTTISPRLSLKHRSSANEYRTNWIWDGVTDNGYQLTKFSGGVAYPLYTHSGDMRTHSFFDDLARELMRLRAGTAAGECSMFTLFNDGSTNITKRVFADSSGTAAGGTGRTLYILN